jgi:hypothetical protein
MGVCRLGRSAWLSLAAIAALAGGIAWAGDGDNDGGGDGDTEADDAAGNSSRLTVRAARRWQDGGPLLHLDPATPTATEGIGAEAHSAATVVELGRLRLATGGQWWQSGLAMDPGGLRGDHDAATAHGWRAAAELSYDLGLVRLGVSGAVGEVDGRLERRRYRDVAVSISRTFQLSRWMHGWISLSLGHRAWNGRPLYGESDATTLLLSIGTTFR